MLRTSAVVAAVALARCDPPGGYYGQARLTHDPGEYRVANGPEPDTLDPGRADTSSASSLIINLFEGLLRSEPRTADPEPGVAERWDVLDGGRAYVFHLRADARWSDGAPVVAGDFVYAWLRVLSPATGAKNAALLFALKNGQAYFHGKAHADDVGVHAVDDRTLRVDLKNPIPYFPALVTHAVVTFPVPRRVIERFANTPNPEAWTLPENMVGNGPFRLAEWRFRHELLFTRSPTYWDAAHVGPRTVRVSEAESDVTSLNLYRAGEIDSTGDNTTIPREMLDHLATKRDFDRAPYLSVFWFWMNLRAPPLSDVRVRHALTMAFDKEALVRYVTRGGQAPISSVVPPGLSGYRPPPGLPHDPARARALLAEAGYPGGRGFPGFTLLYNTSESIRAIAEATQAMWKKELGIDVRLENCEWNVYQTRLVSGDYQVARMGWAGDYADPNTFLEVFLPDSGNNHSGWKDAEYRRLLDEANAQLDPSRRLAVMAEAEKRLLDAAPVLPIYLYTRARMNKPYVHGVFDNLLNEHPWRSVTLSETPAR